MTCKHSNVLGEYCWDCKMNFGPAFLRQWPAYCSVKWNKKEMKSMQKQLDHINQLDGLYPVKIKNS